MTISSRKLYFLPHSWLAFCLAPYFFSLGSCLPVDVSCLRTFCSGQWFSPAPSLGSSSLDDSHVISWPEFFPGFLSRSSSGPMSPHLVACTDLHCLCCVSDKGTARKPWVLPACLHLLSSILAPPGVRSVPLSHCLLKFTSLPYIDHFLPR